MGRHMDDTQTLALISGAVHLNDEVRKCNNPELELAARDMYSQVLSYTTNMTETIRQIEFDRTSIIKTIEENAINAGIDPSVATNPERSVELMAATILTLRTSVKKMVHRLMVYAAFAAIVGAIVAWCIPSLIVWFQ